MDAGVQAGLLAEGKIEGASATLSVIDNANLTRELERFAVNYEVGQTIEFVRGINSQGIAPGVGKITSINRADGKVAIMRPDGSSNSLFRAGSRPTALKVASVLGRNGS